MNASKITNMLIVAIALVIILIYGKALIIPFVIALIFWFLIKEIRDLLFKVKFVKKHIPAIVLNIVGFYLSFLFSDWW